MLQKVLVVVIGLVMSIVGAVSPEGLFASQPNPAASATLGAGTTEETLATLRTSDGQAFARIPVLWVEVDGRRVSEDAWGTGEVDEIRFKVGVKNVDGLALAVGEKVVEVHPTDIFTVRMFRGDFSYRGMGTALASIQLQGSVKTTVLNEGEVTNRLRTETGGFDLGGAAAVPDEPVDGKVAYVVLTTGEKVDTVAVEDGGARLFTEEAPVASEAKNTPGNLLAKWVKIDGRVVREYTWGEGVIDRLEFEPAEGTQDSVVLAYRGETSEIAAGERVVVEDFVGEYLAYQVAGGMTRLRLDGYAASFELTTNLPILEPGNGAPAAEFSWSPLSPKTTDVVSFAANVSDSDGLVVFTHWDFDDNSSTVVEDPTHRFRRAGTYEVTLNVTDNDLRTTQVTRSIIVRNAEPVPDFDFSPKVVTTDSVVAFTDHSYDTDGSIASLQWDFGDGSPLNTTRHPTHRFERGGSVTVTLTATDEQGGRQSISKVLLVRNTPPVAALTFDNPRPQSLDTVQFDASNSSDVDGVIERYVWDFGDSTTGLGSAPAHIYRKPGLYTVQLTVFDDAGDSDTISTQIQVQNRPPFADFAWIAEDDRAAAPFRFSSTSTDADGSILITRWDWGDGSLASIGSTATHSFGRAGRYNVTLTVVDDRIGSSAITKEVVVANSAPRVNFAMEPTPAFRETEVIFTDHSQDPDGDDLVNWTWQFSDGNVTYGRQAAWTFRDIANYTVTLTARDEEGNSASATRTLRVLNRPPSVSAQFLPLPPVARQEVSFTAIGSDVDSPGALSYEWDFGDGNRTTGSSVSHNYSTRGRYIVTVRAIDAEGARSSPFAMTLDVAFALPTAAFSWSPLVPQPGDAVAFVDNSSTINGNIRRWTWDFGDGPEGTSEARHPTYVYDTGGIYDVTLTVIDEEDQEATLRRTIVVNRPPVALFAAPTRVLGLSEAVMLTDLSNDPDGRIENHTWTLGDGRVAYTPNVSFGGYSTPGTYNVTLTVRDDRNATASATRVLSVLNRPPSASWDHTSPVDPPIVGTLLTFDGTNSSDPDNTPIMGYRWTFSDGTPEQTGATTSHAFNRSGRYTVGLVVDDGALASARTPQSHRSLRIGADHAVDITLRGLLPGDREANLATGPFTVKFEVGTPTTGFRTLTGVAVGNALKFTVPVGTWINGEAAVATITSPHLRTPEVASVTLTDDMFERTLNASLRMKVQPTLGVYDATRQWVLDPVLGHETAYRGDALYSDPSERPRGVGVLTYSDGTVAGSQRVDIEARYVPLRQVSGVRNQTTALELVGMQHWCRIDSRTTAENGTFEWEFDGTKPCYLNSQSLYPLGRWEVRALPSIATADNRYSDIRAFYVDPTGGTLLNAVVLNLA